MRSKGAAVEGGDVSLGYVRVVLVGVSIALMLGMILIQIRPLAHWVLSRIAGWPLVGRFHGVLANLYESSYAYTTDAIGFTLILSGLGLAGSGTLFAQATFILGFSVIIASLSTLPGGAGGRELTIGPMLTGLLALSKADAGTATFLIALFQLWVGVLLGLAVIALFRHTLLPPSLEDDIAAYEAARARDL